MDPLYYSKNILKTELKMLEIEIIRKKKLPVSDDNNASIMLDENQISDLKKGIEKLEK